MAVLETHPIYQKLIDLNLPINDYAVFGSGPLFAHGLIDKVGDIDLVARGKAWIMANEIGQKKKTNSGVEIFNGEIEVHDKWSPGDWDIDKLIEEADIIEGIRFVKLETVLRWKKLLGRPKDKKHVEKIEKYLGGD